MAYLIEKSEWEDQVYLIAKTDPLMGGETGVNNWQARQLANRTVYLKDLFGVQHSEDGVHLLGASDVSPNAAVQEAKLALSYHTADCKADDDANNAQLDVYRENIDSLIGAEGSTLGNIYKAIGFSWHYGYERFDFEMFTGLFTLQKNFVSVPIVDHVGRDSSVAKGTDVGDESIDLESTSEIAVDDCYIFDTGVDGEKDVVFITSVLSGNRVRIDHDNPTTVTNKGVLTNSQWTVSSVLGGAHAPKNGSYITDFTNIVSGYASGKVSICYRNPDGDFDVKYRLYGTNEWVDSYLIANGYSNVSEGYLKTYYVPPENVSLMITALEATDIDHFVVTPTEEDDIVSRVRTPRAKGKLQIERFGGLYDDTYAYTEIVVSRDSTLETGADYLRAVYDGDQTSPWWTMYDDFAAKSRVNWVLQDGNTYYWKARHTDAYGNSSQWSTVASFKI